MILKRITASAVYSIITRTISAGKCEIHGEKTAAIVFTGALGDFFVMCGAAKALRDSGYELALVCVEGRGTESAARLTGLFSRVITLKNGLAHRLSNMRRLGGLSVGMVFPAPPGRHPLSDIYTLSVGAERHLLPDTSLDIMTESIKKRADRQAELVKVTAAGELERYSELLNGSGLYHGDIKPFVFAREAKKRRRFAAVFPGAGCAEKRLPPEIWAKALRAFQKKYGLRILLMGGSGDAAVCRELETLLQGCDVRNLCGKYPVSRSIKIASGCRIVFANDSGGAHIGIAAGTPTLVVCGLWQYGRFFPCENENVEAVFGEFHGVCRNCGKSTPDCMRGKAAAPCVAAVTADDILRHASELMDKYNE